MITVACILIFYEYGISSYAALFWFKIITLVLIYYFVKMYKFKEIYYYQNLGISKITLWASTLTIDFFIFIGSLTLTYHFR